MGLTRCRSCKADIPPDARECPSCGAEDPVELLCFVCRKPMLPGDLLSASARGPYGYTYRQTAEGQPLCEQHALVECHNPACGRKARVDQLTERVLDWQYADLSGVERYAPVKGYLCPFCNAKHKDPPSPLTPIVKQDTLQFMLQVMGVVTILAVGYSAVNPSALASVIGAWIVLALLAAGVWVARRIFHI